VTITTLQLLDINLPMSRAVLPLVGRFVLHVPDRNARRAPGYSPSAFSASHGGRWSLPRDPRGARGLTPDVCHVSYCVGYANRYDTAPSVLPCRGPRLRYAKGGSCCRSSLSYARWRELRSRGWAPPLSPFAADPIPGAEVSGFRLSPLFHARPFLARHLRSNKLPCGNATYRRMDGVDPGSAV
jgi:hypothetical protein